MTCGSLDLQMERHGTAAWHRPVAGSLTAFGDQPGRESQCRLRLGNREIREISFASGELGETVTTAHVAGPAIVTDVKLPFQSEEDLDL